MESARRKKRPAYPSPGRQWSGIFILAVTIGCLEAAAYSITTDPPSPGSYLLLVVMLVTYWSGLRTGIIASVISLAYLSYAYSNPGEFFVFAGNKGSRLLSATIFIPAFALLVGSIQGRMRNAAIREFDARESADSEASHRRQTEQELQSSEDMWRLVLNSAMDAIIVMREDGLISLWNRNAEQMFGWTADEAIGWELAALIVPPQYQEAHRTGLQRFIEHGESVLFGKRLELEGITREGKLFPIELNVVPHKTADGHLFIGFVRDVTEQRDLNERLRQAQKMQAIGTLAGGIAHDFNNILAAVSGNLVLAQADVPKDHPVQESLSEIEKAVSRATYVVRQILTFSSAKETKPEVVDLRETLTEALKLLKATLPASMETEAQFEPDLPPIYADSTDIHQIVLNLGINAHHAMRGQSGKFEVKVSQIVVDETAAESLNHIPGHYVRVSVSDTGSGMDAQTLKRVFEPFFTTKAPGEGTGLGLSVVYGIVERHHGAITVYSDPGRGTLFNIYFPAAKVPASAATLKPAVAVNGNGERILYVDDDEALVLMMTRMLKRLNYEVVGYEDPRAALEAFTAAPDAFDIVVTDMSMPYLDGPSIVRQIHAVKPDQLIVMVTGYIRPDDLEQAKNLGIAGLILKPNTVTEMGESLHPILSSRSAEKASV